MFLGNYQYTADANRLKLSIGAGDAFEEVVDDIGEVFVSIVLSLVHISPKRENTPMGLSERAAEQ